MPSVPALTPPLSLLLHNPSLLPREELCRGFLVADRQELLAELKQWLLDERRPRPHRILGAPRGQGKTTMLLRMKYAIEEDPVLRERYAPVVLVEEQYHLGTLADLWLAVLGQVSASAAEEVRARLGVDPFQGGEGAAQRIQQRLQQELLRTGKKLFLCIDNINELFAQIAESTESPVPREPRTRRRTPGHDKDPSPGSKKGGSKKTTTKLAAGAPPAEEWKWLPLRNLLTEDWLRLLGAVPHYGTDDELHKHVESFFERRELGELDEAASNRLLVSLALRHRNIDLASLLTRRPEWARRIYQIAGGNIRSLYLIYRLLSMMKESGRNGRDVITQFMDEITPTYKERFATLAPQGRRLLVALAALGGQRDAASLAHAAGVEPNGASTQLSRLLNTGLVRRIDPVPDSAETSGTRRRQSGRGISGPPRALFEVTEGMMTLYWIMRTGSESARKVHWLVQLMNVLNDAQQLATVPAFIKGTDKESQTLQARSQVSEGRLISGERSTGQEERPGPDLTIRLSLLLRLIDLIAKRLPPSPALMTKPEEELLLILREKQPLEEGTLGLLPEAIREWQKRWAKSEERLAPLAELVLGASLFCQGDYTSALDLMKHSKEQLERADSEGNIDRELVTYSLFLLAWICDFNINEPDYWRKGLVYCQQARAFDEYSAEIWALESRLHFHAPRRERDWAELLKCCERVAQLEPNKSAHHRRFAVALFEQPSKEVDEREAQDERSKVLARASEEARQALRLDPNDLVSWGLLAAVALAQRKVPDRKDLKPPDVDLVDMWSKLRNSHYLIMESLRSATKHERTASAQHNTQPAGAGPPGFSSEENPCIQMTSVYVLDDQFSVFERELRAEIAKSEKRDPRLHLNLALVLGRRGEWLDAMTQMRTMCDVDGPSLEGFVEKYHVPLVGFFLLAAASKKEQPALDLLQGPLSKSLLGQRDSPLYLALQILSEAGTRGNAGGAASTRSDPGRGTSGQRREWIERFLGGFAQPVKDVAYRILALAPTAFAQATCEILAHIQQARQAAPALGHTESTQPLRS